MPVRQLPRIASTLLEPAATDTTVGVTEYDKLPEQARKYLQRIEETTGVPVHVISTSPDRDHTIMMQHPFAVPASGC